MKEVLVKILVLKILNSIQWKPLCFHWINEVFPVFFRWMINSFKRFFRDSFSFWKASGFPRYFFNILWLQVWKFVWKTCLLIYISRVQAAEVTRSNSLISPNFTDAKHWLSIGDWLIVLSWFNSVQKEIPGVAVKSSLATLLPSSASNIKENGAFH